MAGGGERDEDGGRRWTEERRNSGQRGLDGVLADDKQNRRSPYLMTPYLVILWGTSAGMISPNPDNLQAKRRWGLLRASNADCASCLPQLPFTPSAARSLARTPGSATKLPFKEPREDKRAHACICKAWGINRGSVVIEPAQVPMNEASQRLSGRHFLCANTSQAHMLQLL